MKRGYTRRLIDAALNRPERSDRAADDGSRQITIETHKVFVVHRRSRPQGWCVECAEEVELITPGAAAAILRISLRRLFRRVEADRLHFMETDDGLLFICRDSLREAEKN